MTTKTTEQKTARRRVLTAKYERDRAIALFLKAKRRHRGVRDARARLDYAVELLIRVQHGQATITDLFSIESIQEEVVQTMGKAAVK
jgi:hypothetical protein